MAHCDARRTGEGGGKASNAIGIAVGIGFSQIAEAACGRCLDQAAAKSDCRAIDAKRDIVCGMARPRIDNRQRPKRSRGRGRKRAIVAYANKLVRLAYRALAFDEPFDIKRAFRANETASAG